MYDYSDTHDFLRSISSQIQDLENDLKQLNERLDNINQQRAKKRRNKYAKKLQNNFDDFGFYKVPATLNKYFDFNGADKEKSFYNGAKKNKNVIFFGKKAVVEENTDTGHWTAFGATIQEDDDFDYFYDMLEAIEKFIGDRSERTKSY